MVVADRIFDAVAGRVIEGLAVRIEGDRIMGMVPSSETAGLARIELPGHTLLPGLIDLHTHLVGPIDTGRGYAELVTLSAAEMVLHGVANSRATLEAGFTSVRDVGTFRAFTDVALREAIEAGLIPGPRMACAGAYVTSPGGGGDITGLALDVDQVLPPEFRFGVASGVEQMRGTVGRILRHGADFIKVIATGAVLTSGTNPSAPEFTQAELEAAVEEASAAGTYVAAHAHGAEGIKRAVRAGVRSIEHGSLIDAEGVALMAEAGTYLVADIYNGDWIREQGPSIGYSDEAMSKAEATTDAQRAGFRAALAAGVKIGFGTDAGVIPHGHNARQFTSYVEQGMTPSEAIRSATLVAAELMGRGGEIGVVASGALADLIAVPGNPLDNVSLLEQVTFVMKGGNVIKSPVPPKHS